MSESVKIIASTSVQSVAARAFSGTPFCLVETMDIRHAKDVLGRPTFVIFDRLTPDFPVDDYPSGRIFDDTGELKWQKEGETLRMVYIGDGLDGDEQVEIVKETDTSAYSRDDDKILLSGWKVSKQRLKQEMGFETDDEIFIEGAIPQYLHYPDAHQFNDAERIRIQVRQYYDKTGHLEYFRFVGISRVTK